jgi:hypothetical protein
MGCDIHALIEWRYGQDDYWKTLSGKLVLNRAYEVFSAMAGVRSYESAPKPVVMPRGLPDNLNWATVSVFTGFVTDSKDCDRGEWYVSPEKAQEWLTKGITRVYGDEKSHRIMNPDLHTLSWLTTAEFQRALYDAQVLSPDYLAALAAMKSLVADGCEVRLVFGFDN